MRPGDQFAIDTPSVCASVPARLSARAGSSKSTQQKHHTAPPYQPLCGAVHRDAKHWAPP
eukprot:6978083-Prymnesium_polylepis.1